MTSPGTVSSSHGPDTRSVVVLFVSRHGSLRGALAQACMRHLARGRFVVHACGMPGEVRKAIHPAALQALLRAGIASPVDAPRSWNDFVYGARRLDLVIVLDQFAAERLPRWPGQPAVAVWPFDDPERGERPVGEPDALRILHSLRRRIEILVNLPMRGVDRLLLKGDIQDLAYWN